MSAHWFGFGDTREGAYCRNHGGACWAKFGKKNSSSCPQKLGWIANPILRFLFGWIPV